MLGTPEQIYRQHRQNLRHQSDLYHQSRPYRPVGLVGLQHQSGLPDHQYLGCLAGLADPQYLGHPVALGFRLGLGRPLDLADLLGLCPPCGPVGPAGPCGPMSPCGPLRLPKFMNLLSSAQPMMSCANTGSPFVDASFHTSPIHIFKTDDA